MKKIRTSTNSKLTIDTVDYMFVEWLRRQGVLSAFRLNCGFDEEGENAFRTVLRCRIQAALHVSSLSLGSLISVSFVFAHTPEGYAFWTDLSLAWRRFCTDFQNNLK